jgi:hypothetical protein
VKLKLAQTGHPASPGAPHGATTGERRIIWHSFCIVCGERDEALDPDRSVVGSAYNDVCSVIPVLQLGKPGFGQRPSNLHFPQTFPGAAWRPCAPALAMTRTPFCESQLE